MVGGVGGVDNFGFGFGLGLDCIIVRMWIVGLWRGEGGGEG